MAELSGETVPLRDIVLVRNRRSRELRDVLNSRRKTIGFVHEVRPLTPEEMQSLLERHWAPAGVSLPESTFKQEVVARLNRMTSGNLRLLTRLLTQIERVLNVNDAQAVSLDIVEAARDSLVIGEG